MSAYPKIVRQHQNRPLKIGKHRKVLFILPFCFYCNKNFKKEQLLIQHQRMKHFRCNHAGCKRYFNDSISLNEHMEKVHKTSLNKIENAILSRSDPSIRISGMAGVSLEIMKKKLSEISTKYPTRNVKLPPFMLVLASN